MAILVVRLNAGAADVRLENISFRAHTVPVGAVVETARGELVSGGWDSKLKVWINQDGSYRHVSTLLGHRDWISAIAVMPDGDLISADWNGGMKVWRRHRDSYQNVANLRGHRGAIRVLWVTDDGVIIAAGDDRASAWRKGSLGYAEIKKSKKYDALKAAARATGRGVSVIATTGQVSDSRGKADLSLEVWPHSGGLRTRTKEAPNGTSRVVDTRLVEVWRRRNGRYERILDMHNPQTNQQVLSDIALVSDGSDIKVGQIRDGRFRQDSLLQGHRDWVSAMVITRNGLLVSGDWAGTIRVWRVR